MPGPTTSPARGVRRVELSTAEPEPVADFYAHLLGWVVIAEPDGAFTGWVGDRLALRVRPGDSGYRIVFAGPEPRDLRDGAAVDQGRVLHGPWAPGPRAGEPCWVEYTGDGDDYWTGELGWLPHHTDTPFTLYHVPDGQRPVAARRTGEHTGWRCAFAVPDTAKTADLAADTGGRVVVPPADTPAGLTATLADPAGAEFTVLQDPPGWGGAWHTTGP
ncbi:VOC family protein [Saccharothrix obliqua]|uniref:VOC family protein n=1 Tax=Saccharothrix obliqua TaxID=2861747 RepID=UPI001C5E96BC|nr:VOC family protein [Saccharothrix obliqua]MBW4722095.1 VOC family protein [Saccharothrix obliqua]